MVVWVRFMDGDDGLEWFEVYGSLKEAKMDAPPSTPVYKDSGLVMGGSCPSEAEAMADEAGSEMVIVRCDSIYWGA